MLLLGTARARELSASSYRCSAAAVHTGTTSGPPRMWRRGARSRTVPSTPAHGRQSDAVQDMRMSIAVRNMNEKSPKGEKFPKPTHTGGL